MWDYIGEYHKGHSGGCWEPRLWLIRVVQRVKEALNPKPFKAIRLNNMFGFY